LLKSLLARFRLLSRRVSSHSSPPLQGARNPPRASYSRECYTARARFSAEKTHLPRKKVVPESPPGCRLVDGEDDDDDDDDDDEDEGGEYAENRVERESTFLLPFLLK